MSCPGFVPAELGAQRLFRELAQPYARRRPPVRSKPQHPPLQLPPGRSPTPCGGLFCLSWLPCGATHSGAACQDGSDPPGRTQPARRGKENHG